MKRALLGLVVLALVFCGTEKSRAGIIFSDTFEEQAVGSGIISLNNFTIYSGYVDVYGPGFQGPFPGDGNYLSLSNTSPTETYMTLRDLSLDPGYYQIAIDIAGSHRSDIETTEAITLNPNLYDSTGH